MSFSYRVVTNSFRHGMSWSDSTLEGNRQQYVGSNLRVRGNYNRVTGSNNYVAGNNNVCVGSNLQVDGKGNTVTGSNCTVRGSNNRVTGTNSSVWGEGNVVQGVNAKNNGVATNPGHTSDTGQFQFNGSVFVNGVLMTGNERVMRVPAVREVREVKRAREEPPGTPRVPEASIKDEPAENPAKACTLCFVNEPNCAALPCRHFQFCVGCARTLVLGPDHATKPEFTGVCKCPTCREPVIEFAHMFH